MALAWQARERGRHAACGQLLTESLVLDEAHPYVASEQRCYACEAVDRHANAEAGRPNDGNEGVVVFVDKL